MIDKNILSAYFKVSKHFEMNSEKLLKNRTLAYIVYYTNNAGELTGQESYHIDFERKIPIDCNIRQYQRLMNESIQELKDYGMLEKTLGEC